MTDITWADNIPSPEVGAPSIEPVHAGAVQTASEQGSHLAVLMALRHNISAAIDKGIAARDLAALSRRLIEIDREVRSLSKEEDDPVADGLNATHDNWVDN